MKQQFQQWVMCIIVMMTVILPGCSQQSVRTKHFSQLKAEVDRLKVDLMAARAAHGTPASLSQSMMKLAAEAKPSIVLISSDLSFAYKTGTGFIYSEDGYILTTDHVVRVDVRAEKEDKIETFYTEFVNIEFSDGRKTKGQVIGIDPKTDLAAIKIEPDDLPAPLALATHRVQQGELAFSLGHPLGFSWSLQWRPISAAYRTEKLFDTPVHQLDGGFLEGDSGGPLIDLQGKLIGMVYSAINYKFKDDKQQNKTIVYSSIGWAIPAETIAETAPKLIAGDYKITEWKQ
ncbi:MAG: serine protease [Gammaproteobacteria bacterium]|nr:serine protease [Gammaproteobacteria bacterium]